MRGRARKRTALGLMVAGVSMPLAAGTASAATISVTSTADSGAGTLRAALASANNGDLISVPKGTFAVTSSDLNVIDAITIQGAGARSTVIKADGTTRVFSIAGALSEVTISGLMVTGGDAGAGEGGGIRSQSNLNLVGVAVIDNRTDANGGGENGGGVLEDSPNDLLVRDSLIAGNTGYNGGGIYASNDLTVINSTIFDNTAGTPNDNGWGGGIHLGSTALIKNSTIAGNRDFGGPSDHGGGVIYGDVTFVNSILAENRTHDFNGLPPGAGNPGVLDSCSTQGGTYTDGGHNLEDGTDCGFNTSTSQQGADPKLAPPANNGGQTDTLALRRGSRAINRGAACEATDQRGVSRSLGGVCDIGAYERILCGGVTVNVIGTAGKDRLLGTSAADGILGLGGADRLKGLAGNDGLCGGKGRDKLLGGKGRDKLLGGKGRDRLRGGPGKDVLRGGPGRDIQRQ